MLNKAEIKENSAVTHQQEKRDESASSFLEAVGIRIRKVRRERQMTRKALSSSSGVSERYLALMESGQGNVSISLLRQVAKSLQIEPEALLSDSVPSDADTRLIVGLISTLSGEDRQKLKDQILGGLRECSSNRSFRVALTGLRGAGKSTVGKLLSNLLGIPFIELDREIEKLAEAPLSEVFMTYGQQGYRSLEKQCLENLLGNTRNCVIATGGSIVEESSVYDLLLSTCFTVWLKASPRAHMERVIAQGDLRPMAGNNRAMEELIGILVNRQSGYEKADMTVVTDGKNPNTIVRQVLTNQTLKKLIQKAA